MENPRTSSIIAPISGNQEEHVPRNESGSGAQDFEPRQFSFMVDIEGNPSCRHSKSEGRILCINCTKELLKEYMKVVEDKFKEFAQREGVNEFEALLRLHEYVRQSDPTKNLTILRISKDFFAEEHYIND